jgi:phage/plasmid-like protein (TIGR03299 family)
MPAEVETMFSANNEVPWHGLGTVVKDAPTSAAALTLAGLDWSVKKYPVVALLKRGTLYTDVPSEEEPTVLEPPEYSSPSDDFFCVVRETDQKILGTVGTRWQPIQNKEAFAFMDSVAGPDRDVRYETAGSLRGGRRVWMLARLMGKVIAPVPGDETIPYLLMTNLHDGSGFAWVFWTGTRVVCNNTMQIALHGRKSGVRIRHSGKVDEKIELAKQVLGLAGDEVQQFSELAIRLVKHTMNDAQFSSFLEFLMPIPPPPKNPGYDKEYQELLEAYERSIVGVKDTHEKLRRLFVSGPGTEIRGVAGTRWAALQAVTYYTSHLKNHRTDAGRLDSVWFGEGNDLNQKAFQILSPK